MLQSWSELTPAGKEPLKQVGVGIVAISGSLVVTTLARNTSYVSSIPALGAIFPIFITTHYSRIGPGSQRATLYMGARSVNCLK